MSSNKNNQNQSSSTLSPAFNSGPYTPPQGGLQHNGLPKTQENGKRKQYADTDGFFNNTHVTLPRKRKTAEQIDASLKTFALTLFDLLQHTKYDPKTHVWRENEDMPAQCVTKPIPEDFIGHDIEITQLDLFVRGNRYHRIRIELRPYNSTHDNEHAFAQFYASRDVENNKIWTEGSVALLQSSDVLARIPLDLDYPLGKTSDDNPLTKIVKQLFFISHNYSSDTDALYKDNAFFRASNLPPEIPYTSRVLDLLGRCRKSMTEILWLPYNKEAVRYYGTRYAKAPAPTIH